MAKKNDELATTGGGALAVPENLQGGLVIEGQDGSAKMGRLHLYQGTPEEEQKYGADSGFKRGDFIDDLERRKIGDKIEMMILGGFTTWSRWEKGQRNPAYTFTKRSDVPAEDLAWSGEGASRTPPVASECVNAIVVVKGEQYPYLFRFKRTALKAFKETIDPNEARRGGAKRGHGLYTLAGKDDKNAAGQAYKRLSVLKMSEPDAEMNAMASTVKQSIAEWKAKADALAKDQDNEGGGGDSAPPF